LINLKLTGHVLDNFDGVVNILDDKECVNGLISGNLYDKLKFNFYTIDINANRLSKNPNVISEPWFLIYNFVTSEKFDCTYTTNVIKNKFISLISWSSDDRKKHRKKLIEFIEQNSIDCCYSNLENKKTLTELSEYYPNGYYKDNFDYGIPREYFESCIDIVTESLVEFSTHFSEKTYKPIFYKKPFITIAGPYYYETLSDYGFELYDEIFDYGFDSEENYEKRIDNILMQIKELNSLSLREIKSLCEKVKSKIDYNYDHIKKQKPKFSGPRERVVILKERIS